MNRETTLPTIDDRYLLELATAPAQRLFPVLDRTAALRPLLALLAVFPVMVAVVNRSFSPIDAEWGLRALEVREAFAGDGMIFERELLGPDQSLDESRLNWQPPLVSWLTAGIMQLTGYTEPWIVVLVSAFATVGLVLATFALARVLWNDRVAWWSAVIMALHGPFLMMSQAANPIALPMLCCVGTFWGVVRHLKNRPRLMSWPLLTAGVALGGCLLSGGPLGIAVLVPIALYWFHWNQDVSLERKRAGLPPKRRARNVTLSALGLMVLISLSVGGWWSIWMTLYHGGDFVGQWLTGPSVSRIHNASTNTDGLLYRLLWSNVQVFAAFSAFVLVGVCLAGMRLVRRVGFVVGRRPPAAFLLSWFVFGWILRSICLASGRVSLETRQLWQSFTLLAGILLAACAVEAVTQRRLATFLVVTMTLATVLLLMTVPPQLGFTRSPLAFARGIEAESVDGPMALDEIDSIDDDLVEKRQRDLILSFSQIRQKVPRAIVIWLALCVSCVGVVGLWRLRQFLDRHDQRHRLVLIICLIIIFALDAVVSYRGIQNRRLEDDVLAMVRRDFESIESVEQWSVLASQPIPPSLSYTIRSVWPSGRQILMNSWDDVLIDSLAKNKNGLRETVIIEWKEHTTRPVALRMPNVRIREVGQPRFLWKKRLRAYYIVEEPAKFPT